MFNEQNYINYKELINGDLPQRKETRRPNY